MEEVETPIVQLLISRDWSDQLPHRYVIFQAKVLLFLSKRGGRQERTEMHVTKWEQPVQNATTYVIPTISHSGKGTTIGTVKRSVVARGWEGGKKKGICRAQGVFKPVRGFPVILAG